MEPMARWGAGEGSVVVGVDGAGRSHALRAAAGSEAVTVDPADPAEAVAALLQRAEADSAPVVVDDAHRLGDECLSLLAVAARRGAPVHLSRRPTITSTALADLDAAVAASGQVVELTGLSVTEAGALLARTVGRPVDTDRAAAVHASTSGLPALVAALAQEDDDAPLRARVARQLAGLGALVQGAARLLAVSGGAPDEVVSRGIGTDRSGYAQVQRCLYDAGLLAADGTLLPAVATALASGLTAAQRREVHDAIAGAMPAAREPVQTAEQLRAAGARSPSAATAFAAAGERLRLSDPEQAAEWFDLALATGAHRAVVAAGATEAALMLGRPAPVGADDLLDDPHRVADDPATRARLAVAAGIAAAQQGRAGRAADALLAAPAPGPLLAVPSLMAMGRVEEARLAASTPGPGVARLVAEGALLLARPGEALPVLIEAAETMEESPATLLPDTPHAIAAIVAALIGDHATATDLLERAADSRVGGPYAALRHRLLAGWVSLRAGRLDEARSVLERLGGGAMPGRERLLVAVITAGLARRSGEVSTLREVWPQARPALVRRAVDLLAAEQVEELVVAAARLDEGALTDGVLSELHTAAAGLEPTSPWRLQVEWSRLQAAVAVDDAQLAERSADAIAALLAAGGAAGPRGRQQVLASAGRVWADAVAGRVDDEQVLAAAGELTSTGLRWEASRLCGHAAIRTTDQVAARRLLERARDLGAGARSAPWPTPGGRGTGGLSDREVEIARMVLAGQTHKAIGAQLFLSPKTVEHHVARIRGKLGASSRAEMIAALRGLSLDG